jgi:predicted RNA-binding Zn-ribbon protein involved in translation (DUF1610 family)
MGKLDDKTQRLDAVVINSRDIVFECPSCGNNLVVDESAQGLIVDCPQCRISVIVPPKPASTPATPTPPPPPPQPKAPEPTATAPVAPVAPVVPVVPEPKPGVELAALHERLIALGNQLRELQTQRTEINTRLATRVNEINRDLVLSARLETSHQQLMSELQKIVGQIGAGSGQPAASSAGAQAGRSRVQFGH